MKIINTTTNTIISSDIIIADSFIAKNLGLIPYASPKTLLLKTRFGIHTFGMRYPIDIVILDKYNKIVKFRKSLKPNRIFLWNPAYTTVLELPSGTIIRKKLAHADRIHIQQ